MERDKLTVFQKSCCKLMRCFFIVCITSNAIFAQFSGPVGSSNTTAIYKDSAIFSGWASACSVVRGYQDISDVTLGFASIGDIISPLGQAEASGVLSLGDGGQAILTFDTPIFNGNGFDFAVFENAFNDSFLELAFVEVSSDGVVFYRFPSTSNTQTITQIGPFDNSSDATKINNLAGKYRANYGTPFDLEELNGEIGLDIMHITHIKIIDVVGSINPVYATYDSNNNAINDPFQTPFASSGFDLDAVGVIHQQPLSIDQLSKINFPVLFPNPLQIGQKLTFNSHLNTANISVFDSKGNLFFTGKPADLNTSNFDQGIYFIHITSPTDVSIIKLIVQQ